MSAEIQAARQSRDDAISECMDAAHDAIHDVISEMYECQAVKGAVASALEALRITSDEPLLLSCQFCHEADFDLLGLKTHYQRGHCAVFEAT